MTTAKARQLTEILDEFLYSRRDIIARNILIDTATALGGDMPAGDIFAGLIDANGFPKTKTALMKAIDDWKARPEEWPPIPASLISGILSTFGASPCAFVATIADGGGYSVSVAVKGETGHYPLPAHLIAPTDGEEAGRIAMALNRAIRVDEETANAIILSTLF